MSAAMSVSEIDADQETTGSRDPTDAAAWFDDALPRLFGYFISRVGGRVAVAEDLTQETMLAAVRSETGPDDADAILPWLFGIARHKLMDHYRRLDRERRHFGPPSDPEDILASAPALPDLDLDALHVRDAIIATLDKLPPRQRGALVLRYIDGCDVPATAALLDTTIHAAESLLARARVSFRDHYHALTGEDA
ncbi:MAG TPA: sigma-70 family RNA polymerase sigma factor [Thermomicrobiales bacterium]|nr:sigma-70 family RNA polymerase sigma factor [Thermomicrobiales bacterium]